MRSATKLASLGVVIAVGVIASLPFRKAESPDEPRLPEIPVRFERRARPERPILAADQQRPRATKTRPLRVPTASTGFIPEQPQAAPKVPANVRRSFNPMGSLFKPIDGGIATDEERDGDGENHAIQHKVVDGDTLSSLAARYYGDATRYNEIFEFNRSVLKNPDLLPIGGIIEIPPRNRSYVADEAADLPMTRIPRGQFQADDN